MRHFFTVALLSTILFSLTSCTSSSQSVNDEGYRIDYYSGGGFTGMESGLTIFSNGTVIFWKKKLNSPRETTDSIRLSAKQIKKFNEITANPELFTYSWNISGNYTTHLIITKDIQLNQVSFNASDLPAGMPDSIRNLISEIKNIIKYKGA